MKLSKVYRVLICFLATIVLLVLTSCGDGYSAAKSYKTVVMDGLSIDIRDDMVRDIDGVDAFGSISERYYCEYFGVTVTGETKAALALSGCESSEDYLNMLAYTVAPEAELCSDKGFQYFNYIREENGVKFTYTAYAVDMGNKYYLIEFYTKSSEYEDFISEYTKIVSTAQAAEKVSDTIRINVSGVMMTVSNEVSPLNEWQYYGPNYCISAKVVENESSAKKYADEYIKKYDLKTDEESTPKILTLSEGCVYFVSFSDESYCYNYFKSADGAVIRICFTTEDRADDALMKEFEEMIGSAEIA